MNDESKPSDSPSITGVTKSGRDAVIEFGTRRMTTNWWGAPPDENLSPDVNYIFFEDPFGWEWNRPSPKLLHGEQYAAPIYPSVHVGKNPWGGYQTTSKFPRKWSEIESLTYEVDFEFAKVPTGEYNFNFDTWFTPTDNPDMNTRRKEVMVTFYDTSYPPEDKYGGDVSDGINTFRYYAMNPDFSSFVTKRPAEAGPHNFKVDIKKLIDFLIEKGRLDKNLFLCQVDLGDEAWKSEGAVRIDKFTVDMDGVSV